MTLVADTNPCWISGRNDCRKDFMINLHESIGLDRNQTSHPRISLPIGLSGLIGLKKYYTDIYRMYQHMRFWNLLHCWATKAQVSQRKSALTRAFNAPLTARRILVPLDLSAWLYGAPLASGDFCHPLITFANSLDADQDSWSGSKLFNTVIVFLKVVF